MLLCPFPGEAENGWIAAAEAGNDETAAEEGKFAVSGTVRDSTDSNPVAGAVVELIDTAGQAIAYTSTDEAGAFSLETAATDSLSLKISILGYHPKILDKIPEDGTFGDIPLSPDTYFLQSAQIKEQAIRSSQSGDTLIYNAAAYQVILGADSESLLSKMPGISVSDVGVDANGRDVRKIMVDGQEFFGDNVLTALKNIPADMISQIEVINKLSDTGELTGIDDGEGYTAINIVTKPQAKNGSVTGRLYGSYGIPDKYMAGGNVNWFGKKHSLSVLGMGNNISQYNFSASDIAGASAETTQAAGSEFRVKPLPGLSSIASTGVNYSNKWFSGSYFFNRIDNGNLSSGLKETMLDDTDTQVSRWTSDFNALNYNHRFSAKITLSPGKRHSITIRPYAELEDRNDGRSQQTGFWRTSGNDTTFLRNRLNTSDNGRWAIRAGGSLSYRYRFGKRGRSLSASLSGRYYRNTSEELTWQYTFRDEDSGFIPEEANSRSSQTRDRLTEQTTFNAGLNYIEPLGKRSRISIECKFSGNISNGDNLVHILDNDTGEYSGTPDNRQSAANRSTFLTSSAGVRYNYTFKKMTVTAQAGYQNINFRGTYVMPFEDLSERSFNNFIYNIIANIPVNPQNTFRIEGRSRTANPGVNVLQNVVNLNNTSNIRAGNPDLVPSYIHDIRFRYIHTSKTSGSTISAHINWLNSPNYVCDSLVINSPDFEVSEGILLGEGNQYVKPINLGGYNKLSGKFTWGFPLKFLRSNFNLNAGTSMTRLPGMINGEEVPVFRSNYSLGLRIDSNISENIDFSVGYTGGYTSNEYSGKFGKTENNFISQTATGRLKWAIWKDFTFTCNIRYRQDVNTDKRYNDQFLFCDILVGKRLFRNRLGEISVGIRDLFDDGSRSYRHGINSSGRTDTINQGVGRFWTLQFVYHLRAYKNM